MNCLQQPLFQEHQYSHSCKFFPTLRNVVRRKWCDFDHHRNKMKETLSKIRNVNWITVDSDKYNDFIGIENYSEIPFITSSRYGHRNLNKCFPSYNECVECFKYHCIHCGEGTNSLYGGRCSKKSRCSKMINCYPELKEINSKPKQIYIFENNDIGFFFLSENSSLISKDIYGL